MATHADTYGPAMTITDQTQADQYFDALVEARMVNVPGLPRADAEAMERQNLGYYAGYYSHEIRQRVETLFNCVHPIFGSIVEHGPPTADAACVAGQNMATHGFAARYAQPTTRRDRPAAPFRAIRLTDEGG